MLDSFKPQAYATVNDDIVDNDNVMHISVCEVDSRHLWNYECRSVALMIAILLLYVPQMPLSGMYSD